MLAATPASTSAPGAGAHAAMADEMHCHPASPADHQSHDPSHPCHEQCCDCCTPAAHHYALLPAAHVALAMHVGVPSGSVAPAPAPARAPPAPQLRLPYPLGPPIASHAA